FLALKAAHDTLAKSSQRSTQTNKTARVSPPNGVPVRSPTPAFGVSISTPSSTPPRGIAVTPRPTPAPQRVTATPATPFPARPLRKPSASPPPRPEVEPNGSGRFAAVRTPPPAVNGVSAAKPNFDENRVLAAAHELLRSGRWTSARQAFHAL